MSIELPLENAPLTQLQQTPIDNVLNIIDQGLVHLPSYRELFYRWERQQWRAEEIDFSPDRFQWEKMGPQERQDRLYGLSAFFRGEACVTDTLGPYITAMPDEEMRLFLTTQLSDEARHTVFFARFFREVLGIERETLEDTLVVTHQYMNSHLQYILIEALSEVAERIRQEPAKIAHLVEGITLYHVIVEGSLAFSTLRPGFTSQKAKGGRPEHGATSRTPTTSVLSLAPTRDARPGKESEMVSAVVLINVQRGHVNETAQSLLEIEGVSEVYS